MIADKRNAEKTSDDNPQVAGISKNVTTPQEVTELLDRWSQGDEHALDALIAQVYPDLRRVARYLLRIERPGHTLQATALANEAYLKLAGNADFHWKDRTHFLAVAARAMRQVLIDHARRRLRDKRGGDLEFVPLEEGLAFTSERSKELLALDEALERLSIVNPRQSRIVELRYFGGLSNEEIGKILGIVPNTVIRGWNEARAWLGMEMKDGPDERRS